MTEVSAILSVAQLLGGRLVTGLALGLLLAMVAAIFVRITRNSSTRFAISFFTLLAIAVFPLAACLVSGEGMKLGSATPISVPGGWALALFIFWIFGATMGLFRIALGLLRVRRIRQHCTELDPSSLFSGSAARDVVSHALAECSRGHRVSLRISHDVSVPTAAGFFRPAVLLPAWAMTDLSPAELNSVLLHELGHLRRWDDWTNLTQKILKALLFFHPAVWWIDSRLALERESACDDFVLAQTSDARGYANCLVSVAEKTLGRRALSLAVAAVGRFQQTAERLTRILDQNRLGGTHVSKPALAGIAVLAFAFAVGLPHIPSIVVFGDARPVAEDVVVVPVAAGVDPTEQVPKVIPASIRIPSQSLALKKAELRTSPHLGEARRSSKPRLSRLTMNQTPKSMPILVETTWSEQESAPVLVFVTQTVACDESGSCFISVRSWQVLTVLRAKPTESQTGSSAKSI